MALGIGVATPSLPSSPTKFREGRTYLVPYREIKLVLEEDQPLNVDHVFIGPTPDVDLSIASMKAYLADRQSTPVRGVDDSLVPFRG